MSSGTLVQKAADSCHELAARPSKYTRLLPLHRRCSAFASDIKVLTSCIYVSEVSY